MYLTEEQLKKYSCKLERKFYQEFLDEYRNNMWFDQIIQKEMYDSNDMLKFLFDYPEINDKSKQYFFFMCMKTFGDVPKDLIKKYTLKFALNNCGKEIYNSYACTNSNLLIGCNLVKDSFGCNNCKFSDHLIYCSNCRHCSYMAFNKEVTKARFNALIKMSPEKLQKTPEFHAGLYAEINAKIEYIYKVKEDAA